MSYVLASATAKRPFVIPTLRRATANAQVIRMRAGVLAQTNRERVAHGARPLKQSIRLTAAAQGHAEDMARQDYFDHTSMNGTSWDDRILRAGWRRPAAENIAFGQDDAAEVVMAWMKSPGHRRNLLDPRFQYIGIGFAADGDYWVQDFGY